MNTSLCNEAKKCSATFLSIPLYEMFNNHKVNMYHYGNIAWLPVSEIKATLKLNLECVYLVSFLILRLTC